MVSAKGSPGVTTSALAVASTWPRPVVVVEADPFGGDVRAGLGRGEWPPGTGLMELVVDLRSMGPQDAVRRQAHQIAPHMPAVIAGLGRVGQAASVPWGQIAGALRSTGCDVVADCGRFAPTDGVVPLLAACDVVIVVCRSSLPAARAAARLVPLLQSGLGADALDPRVSLLVVAPGAPYPADEVARCCGLPLLGDLPDDARSSEVWTGGARPPRGFGRRRLQLAARTIGARLASMADASRGAA